MSAAKLTEYPRWTRWMAIALLAGVLGAAGTWLYAKYGVSDTERIRRSLAAIELAVETRQARALMR
jgi:hypothetical protein